MTRLRLPAIRTVRGPTLSLLATLAVAACAAQQPQSHASAAQQAACKQRADEVYLRQNRADIYRADTYATSTRDAPLSGLPQSNTTSGLSGRYARDVLLSNCLNGIGGTAGASPQAAPEATPLPPPPPPPPPKKR
ncbi:hypothetical protein [Limobrevibacterium gyesilva]|uniref:Lipoprotein n=1 Tax=Limobrevibacterium gyesilva TaxID=2991712 RepID=A0AA42CHJ1_9PROT|nr:hypothetical protein [Limobrevibacterium gyesilva]MCW3475037.1 hypothetical protein [Limobrevibacterium gyesilva]